MLYRVIESVTGGLQGCPLMAACHGVVQKVLMEAIGITSCGWRTTPVAPALDPPAQLELSPGFADDGYVGGRIGGR